MTRRLAPFATPQEIAYAAAADAADLIAPDQTITPTGGNIVFDERTDTLALGSTNYAHIAAERGNTLVLTGTTGTMTGGGHVIGGYDQIILNLGSVTLPLAYAGEAVFQNLGTSTRVTQGLVHGAHMAMNVGTIDHLVFYQPIMSAGENPGTISQMSGLFLSDMSGSPDVPAIRHAVFNLDPGADIATAGIVRNAMGQFSPSNGSGYVANRYYYGLSPNGALQAQSLIADIFSFIPFHVQRRATFTKIGCRVTTGAASSHIQLGVYSIIDGVLALITNSTSLDTATTGDKEATIAWAAEPGNYFLGCVPDGGPTINWVVDNAAAAFIGFGTSSGGETLPIYTGTFGTWPASPAYTLVANGPNQFPMIWVRL